MRSSYLVLALALSALVGCGGGGGDAPVDRPLPQGEGSAASPVPAAPGPAAAASASEITGVVLDPEGNPTKDATVVYHKVVDGQTSWGGQEVTGADGRFTLGGLAAGGEYILQAKALHYVEPSVFHPTGEPVAAGTSGVQLTLRRGGSVAGVLLGPDGSPLADTNVVLGFRTEGGYKASAQLSESDGTYLFDGLEAGAYTLKATGEGLKDITEEMSLEVGEGEEVSGIELRATRTP